MTVSYRRQPVLTGAADVTAAMSAQTALSRRHGVRICRILGRPVLASTTPLDIRAALTGEEIGHFDHTMLETADRLNSGEDVATVPWEQVRPGWACRACIQRPDANMRTHTFGSHGEGLMIYLVLDDQRRVVVRRVLSAGSLKLARAPAR